MKDTLLCFVNVAMLVIGQMLFKYGTNGKNLNTIGSIIKIMFSPVILSGLILYGFATMLWLYILNRVPISRAHPIQAMSYPVMLILAKYVFSETIPYTRWIGIGIVFIGIVFIVQQ